MAMNPTGSKDFPYSKPSVNQAFNGTPKTARPLYLVVNQFES